MFSSSACYAVSGKIHIFFCLKTVSNKCGIFFLFRDLRYKVVKKFVLDVKFSKARYTLKRRHYAKAIVHSITINFTAQKHNFIKLNLSNKLAMIAART